MKKFDVDRTVQILANLGVIAGILFLGLELQQNSRLLTAQTQYLAASVEIDLAESVASDAEMADLLDRAMSGEMLSMPDRYRLSSRARSILLNLQWLYQQAEAGNLEGSETLALRARSAFSGNWLVPASVLSDTWERTDQGFDQEFVRWVNEIRSDIE